MQRIILRVVLIAAICLYCSAMHSMQQDASTGHVMHQQVDTVKAIKNAWHNLNKTVYRSVANVDEAIASMNAEGFYCSTLEETSPNFFRIKGKSPYQYHMWVALGTGAVLGASLALSAVIVYCKKIVAKRKPMKRRQIYKR